MNQQITIIVMIDTMAAIKANKLDDYIYLFDDLNSKESVGLGTSNLTTAIDGTYWADGSQASDAILNWLIAGVGSLPATLPRRYVLDRTRRSDQKILEDLRQLVAGKQGPETNQGLLDTDKASKGLGILTATKSRRATGAAAKIRRATSVAAKLLDLTGRIVPADQEYLPYISLQPPIITNITGEAVDKGIVYPVQGGTPIGINAGWYWNATLSTYQPGIYSYTMHFTLYNPIFLKGGTLEWEPVEMTHTASIWVKSRPMKNGFTHGAMGLLPIF